MKGLQSTGVHGWWRLTPKVTDNFYKETKREERSEFCFTNYYHNTLARYHYKLSNPLRCLRTIFTCYDGLPIQTNAP